MLKYSYNWNTLKEYNLDKIKEYFTYIYVLKGEGYKFLLENSWAREIHTAELKDSYILNLEGFLDNKLKGTKVEQLVYLDLLSLRSTFTYYNTKGKSTFLPVWKAEKMYDIEKLKANRLLKLDENNIYFVYEQEIIE